MLSLKRLLALTIVLQFVLVATVAANNSRNPIDQCRNLLQTSAWSMVRAAVTNMPAELTVGWEIRKTKAAITAFTNQLVVPKAVVNRRRYQMAAAPDGTVMIGNMLLRSSLEGDYLKASRLVFAHEYGHVIFDANLANQMSEYRDIIDIKTQFRPQLAKIEKLTEPPIATMLTLEILSAVFSGVKENKEILLVAALADRQERWHGASMPVARLYSDAFDALPKGSRALDTVSMAYSEIFADVVAVLLTEDVNAVANTVSDPSRSFEVTSGDTTGQPVDVYSITAQSRQTIATSLLRRHPSSWHNEYKRFVVNTVFNAAVEALKSFQLLTKQARKPEDLWLTPTWGISMSNGNVPVPPPLQRLINSLFIDALMRQL